MKTMREILFRGKRKDNGEWVYGDLLNVGVDYDYAIRTYGGRDHGQVNAVNEKTVGQYTGLTDKTDKNGKKIFEGDILNTSNSNCRIWYVDYKNTAFCANQGNANYSCVLDEFMQYSIVEVIGNIHDDPELLKGACNA